METKPFWGIQNLGISQRKDITIIYCGRNYSAYFYVDPLDRARLYWHSDLQNEFMKNSSADPAAKAVFEKVDDDLYYASIVIGSEAVKYKKHTCWIIPCSPDTYDCMTSLKSTQTEKSILRRSRTPVSASNSISNT